MGKADGLNRRLDWQEGVENNNKDQILIKPEQIKRIETLVKENDLRNRIRKAQKGNERVVKAMEELKRAEMKILKNKEWTIE